MTRFVVLLISLCILFAQEKQLYTCGMHPHIITDKPEKCPICKMELTPVRKQEKKTERVIKYWRAPMDPNEIYDKPGKSKMGMDLVPVYSDGVPESDLTISISPQIKQAIGLISQHPQLKSVKREIETNGVVKFDQTKVYHMTLKLNGWIESSSVTYIGQPVQKNEVLFRVYSPEAVAAIRSSQPSLS